MQLIDIIRTDLNEEPVFVDTGDAAQDWMDYALALLIRERWAEAGSAAEGARTLVDGSDRDSLRAMTALVLALARLGAVRADIEPLLDEAIQKNPYGLGRIASKARRAFEEIA